MSIAFQVSNREAEQEAELTASEVIDRVNEMLGYDILETQIIEKDSELYGRVITRLSTAGDTVPLDEALPDDPE